MGRRWETQCFTRRWALQPLESIDIEAQFATECRKLKEFDERPRGES